MLFNSVEFIALFSAVLLLYFLPTGATARRQNMLLLAASYVFYGAWDWRFLGLIFFTTLSTFLTARILDRHPSRVVAGINIGVNLAILAVFKYFNFFGENLCRLFKLMGWSVDWVFVDILLPVGISFYTFQAIGYTVDAYRGNLKNIDTNNFLLFAVFIAYFPQLVAGPIERAGHIMPQLAKRRLWNGSEAVEGLRRVLWGLVKKIVIADQCGMRVDALWDKGMDGHHGAIGMFVATLLFTVQIYCDFSGYCDIALGISRVLGIRLMENFRRSYFSRSVLEFWHRWHVSLMEWFTQYVYIPLGGSRVSRARHLSNIFIVFLLSGLWHGASWCFIAWGDYWGAVYILARVCGCDSYKNDRSFELSRPYGVVATMSFVVVGLAIFRSSSIEACARLLAWVVPLTALLALALVVAIWLMKHRPVRLAVYALGAISVAAAAVLIPGKVMMWYFLFFAAAVFVCEWKTRHDDVPLYPLPRRRTLRYAVYILLYLAIITAPVSDSAFIYFQF